MKHSNQRHGTSSPVSGPRTQGYGRLFHKSNTWIILITAACLSILQGFPARAATVGVNIIHSQDKYPVGGSYPILVELRISESCYIHSALEVSDAFLLPTVLSFQTSPGVVVKDIRFPAPALERFAYSERPVEVYSGGIRVRVLLQVEEGALPGKTSLEGTLYYQACTARSCMPPEEIPVSVDLTLVPAGADVEKLNTDAFAANRERPGSRSLIPGEGEEANLLLVLLLILISGMALNLTPCIYPLIPITISYFGGMSNQFRGKTVIHGILYILGLSLTNSVLGVLASLTGSMIGEWLQNAFVLFVVAFILVSLALSFFGLWELRLPSALTRASSKNFGGYFGTFFMGLTLGIVAAPCLGPFILALLTYVAKIGDPYLGFLYFFTLSVGMGFPLSVLAVFSGTVNRLPVSGAWLIWIRKALGWVLIGMAFYVLVPLILKAMGPGAVTLVTVLLTAAAGLHLGWLDRTDGRLKRFHHIKKGLGTGLICLAVVFFLIDFPGGKKEGVKWLNYEPNLLELAAKKKRPVILDFYAEWCPPCRAMEEDFAAPEVLALTKGIVMVRVDLTLTHPYQTHLRRQYDIKGVPTILFINRDGRVLEDLTIESYVDKAVIMERIRALIKE